MLLRKMRTHFPEISVAVERGGLVESQHRVHAAKVRDGEIVDSWGDPDLVTFVRSAAKPLQALPLVQAVPDLTDEEVAVACASHEARPEQLAAVHSLLARAGARAEEDLECGPVDGSRLRHNCSGKHAGMLILARMRRWPRRGYGLLEHPLQGELLELLADAAGLPRDEIDTAIDGCGALTFAMPLRAMASAFSRLVRGELAGSQRVIEAMLRSPELVGGPQASDTRVMQALPGAVAKRGAEGVLCVALPDGTGIALKVEDGSARAVVPAAGRLLGISALAEIPTKNSRGDVVGRMHVEA